MKQISPFRILAAIIYLAAAAYLIAIYPMLPERIAVHYNAAGEPDGWGGKLTFTLLICGIFGAINVWLLFGVPAMFRLLPARWMNFPTRRQKEYWTATPQRLARVRGIAVDFMSVLMIPMNLLMLMIVQVTYQTNVPNPAMTIPFTPVMWTITALLLVVAVGGTVWMFLALRVPRDTEAENSAAT